MMNEVDIRVHPKFLPLYSRNTYRYKVFYGGRAGLKSWAFAQALVAMATQETLFILCAREIQKSIRESVHALLGGTIKRMQLEDCWEIQKALTIHQPCQGLGRLLAELPDQVYFASLQGRDLLLIIRNEERI